MKKPAPLVLEYAEDLGGKRFCFFGSFEAWPRVLGSAGPKAHVERRGGRLAKTVDRADYLVIGDKRGKGKADALRRAEALRAKGKGPQTLDERAFLHLVRPKLDGKAFLFVGGLSRGLDLEGEAAMVTAAGARVAGATEDAIDFVVIGEGRAKGKAALLARIEELQRTRKTLHVLDEGRFLELLACLRRPEDANYDARALAMHLRSLTDAKKVDRAIRMLKKQALQLYSQATADAVGGIVKSQTVEDASYACWIREDGQYSCFDATLAQCMGLSGDLCKHLVVLLLGLAVQGVLDPRRAYAWALAASKKWPAEDQARSAELILRYRGAQAGEIDWRPTETVPEDYYAL